MSFTSMASPTVLSKRVRTVLLFFCIACAGAVVLYVQHGPSRPIAFSTSESRPFLQPPAERMLMSTLSTSQPSQETIDVADAMFGSTAYDDAAPEVVDSSLLSADGGMVDQEGAKEDTGGERKPRAVVTCAYTRRTLCQAYGQIRALQALHASEEYGPVHILIYHADELYDPAFLKSTTTSSDSIPYRANVRSLVQNLQALPNVHIRSIVPWLRATYASDAEEGGRTREEEQQMAQKYRGFFCKPAALLATLDEGYDVAALVDLDTVLLHSPFDLLSSPIFQETGAYLFRDRRIHPEPPSLDKPPTLPENITRAWSWVHPSAPLAPFLAQSDLFQNLTMDYGESALVLWNRTAAPAATEMLRYFVHPDRLEDWGFGYGDKEFFFLSFAFSDDAQRLVMSSYMPANVGREKMVGVKITTGEVVKASQVCSVGGMAQFVDASNGDETAETVGYAGQRIIGTPEMFYLNGDDIEQLLDYSPSAFEHAVDLLQVAPVNTVKDGMAGFCTFGSYGLPELAKNKLRNYYYPYEQCIMRGLTAADIAASQ